MQAYSQPAFFCYERHKIKEDIVKEIFMNVNQKLAILEKLKEEYAEERRRNQNLAEENKELKLYSAISGNAEHNRLMKNHINRLVKEIDMCVSELQNNGL